MRKKIRNCSRSFERLLLLRQGSAYFSGKTHSVISVRRTERQCRSAFQADSEKRIKRSKNYEDPNPNVSVWKLRTYCKE